MTTLSYLRSIFGVLSASLALMRKEVWRGWNVPNPPDRLEIQSRPTSRGPLWPHASACPLKNCWCPTHADGLDHPELLAVPTDEYVEAVAVVE